MKSKIIYIPDGVTFPESEISIITHIAGIPVVQAPTWVRTVADATRFEEGVFLHKRDWQFFIRRSLPEEQDQERERGSFTGALHFLLFRPFIGSHTKMGVFECSERLSEEVDGPVFAEAKEWIRLVSAAMPIAACVSEGGTV